MDFCDPWTDISDSESHDDQEAHPAEEEPPEQPEDTVPDPWDIHNMDPWPFLGPPHAPETPVAEPVRSPSEEVLAMAWGDLHSVSNSWPVTIELQDERNQMELEDHLATQQRQMDQDERNQMELEDHYATHQRRMDQEEEQSNWYTNWSTLGSLLDCKTEPSSNSPSEEDPALQAGQESEYEEITEETKRPAGPVPEPSAPPRAAQAAGQPVPDPAKAQPPWRTNVWTTYWNHYPEPAAATTSNYSRPSVTHHGSSMPASAAASVPSPDMPQVPGKGGYGPTRDHYNTGWKAKVAWFIFNYRAGDYTRCDTILQEYLGNPPQPHQIRPAPGQKGGKDGATWAQKAIWLLDAYQARKYTKVDGLCKWQLDNIVFSPQ